MRFLRLLWLFLLKTNTILIVAASVSAIAFDVGHIAFAGFPANFAAIFFAFADCANTNFVSAFVCFLCHKFASFDVCRSTVNCVKATVRCNLQII